VLLLAAWARKDRWARRAARWARPSFASIGSMDCTAIWDVGEIFPEFNGVVEKSTPRNRFLDGVEEEF
jgi:hypothetical protein